MKLSKVFVIVAFALITNMVTAATLGSLIGKIIDKETKKPLQEVNILISGTNYGSSTDLNGNYFISKIPIGKHDIVVSMLGYKTIIKKVKIDLNRKTKSNFKLEETMFNLEDIVITATRTPRFVKDIPLRTSVVTNELIEVRSASNVYEALESTPGVRVEQQCAFCNFSQIRLQGLGSNHTQVLIDGQPTYSGLASVYGLQQLGSADIDKIEIVKGAGSSMYGSGAVAGAVNIITKKPTAIPEFKLGMEIGEYGTKNFNFNASGMFKDIGVVVTGQNTSGDAIDRTSISHEDWHNADIKDDISDRVETDNYNLSVKLVKKNITNRDQLSFKGTTNYEHRQGGTLTDDYYTNPFTDGTERIITKRNSGSLNYKKIVGDMNEINASISYTNHIRNATNDTFLGDYESINNKLPSILDMRPYTADEDLLAFNMNYFHNLTDKHNLLIGFQASNEKLKESGMYVTIDKDNPNYGQGYKSKSTKKATEFGIYTQDEWKATDKIETVFGVRYDYHDSKEQYNRSKNDVSYTENMFNPRFAIKYQLFSNFTLRSSIGTGTRVPYGFAEDLHLCSGSPKVWKSSKNLEPEKSISYNFSFDYDPTNKICIGVNFFRTDLTDKIDFADAENDSEAKINGYDYQWENIGDAFVEGIEVDLSYQARKNLRIEADATFNKGEYKNKRDDWKNTEFYSDSKNISRFPKYTIGTSAIFKPGNWLFSINADLKGPMYIDFSDTEIENEIEIFETDPFVTIDTKVSYSFFKKYEFYVGAKNLTDYVQDERRDDAAFMYAPIYGRIMYGGINYSF